VTAIEPDHPPEPSPCALGPLTGLHECKD
jgi:hypothetical protein